jgi:hypothetical protein
MKMNYQEIFDTVARAILKQGVPSVGFKSSGRIDACQYRGVNGAKCAVGHLITDDEYSRSMENMNVLDMQDRKLLPERLIPFVDFLKELQVAHDNPVRYEGMTESYEFIPEFIKNMRGIAKKYNLNEDVFDKTT